MFDTSRQSLTHLTGSLVFAVLQRDTCTDLGHAISKASKSVRKSSDDLRDLFSEIEPFFVPGIPEKNYEDGLYPELHAQPLSTQDMLFKVCNTVFSIHCSNDLLRQHLAELLAPISVVTGQHHVSIDITNSAEDFSLNVNDLPVEQGLLFNEVVPVLIDRLQILAYQRENFLFCFHGAAVVTQSGGLLMPGVSGAGKSTLAARLCEAGATLYSDEMMVFDEQHSLLTIPLPIAIKEGSWSLFPQLDKSKIWKRVDGRRLKYLWPEAFSTEFPSKRLSIFPRFGSSASQPERLSTFQALSKLVEGGYQVSRTLTADDIESLLSMLDSLPCYQLGYIKTEYAMQMINAAWENPS